MTGTASEPAIQKVEKLPEALSMYCDISDGKRSTEVNTVITMVAGPLEFEILASER